MFNSSASKFELRAQPLSAGIKMSPHVPNCTLNDFHILMLPLAVGIDIVPWNLQRHLHASSWFVILYRLGVFTSATEEKMVKLAVVKLQRTHQGGKGAMKLRCRCTVVCRPSVPSLNQLAPSKFAPSKGGTVVKWLLLPRNFTRLALPESLLLAM